MKKIQIILAAAVAMLAVSCAMENFGDGWYSYNGKEAMADALYGEEVEDPSGNNFAAGIAAYGLTLRSSQYKGQATVSMAYDLVNGAKVSDPFGYRARFAELIKHASELK